MGLSGDHDLAVCLQGQAVAPFGFIRWIISIDAIGSERRI